MLFKDVAARHRIRAPGALEDLAYVLLANAGRETSSRSLALLTKCRSPHTGEKYLRHLEEAFLFFRVPRFSFKVREQRTANRKVYCVDNGFISAAAFRASPGTGQLYENLVAIDLHRRALSGRCQVFFYRSSDGAEVDFVVKEGTRVTHLIQVCARFEAAETRPREVRALLKAGAELGCDDLLVLTGDVSGEEEASRFGRRGTIRYFPLTTWLRRD